MGRSVHFGSGQIAGKNAFDFYANAAYRRLFSETFTVTDVQLKSTEVIRWKFVIGMLICFYNIQGAQRILMVFTLLF